MAQIDRRKGTKSIAIKIAKDEKSSAKAVNEQEEGLSIAFDDDKSARMNPKKFYHAALLCVKARKSGRHMTYKTNEDVWVNQRERIQRPFGHAKAEKEKDAKVLKHKRGGFKVCPVCSKRLVV